MRSTLQLSGRLGRIGEDESSSYSWHTADYFVALKLCGAFLIQSRLHVERTLEYPGRSGDAVQPAAAVPFNPAPAFVAAFDNVAGECIAVSAAASGSDPDPLVFASLCDLLYDDPGEPPKPDWTAAQWNAALQQQPWTASWQFLMESGTDDRVYFGIAFKDTSTGQIVVANRGTQTAYDLRSDLDILCGVTPPAFYAARQFAAQVVQNEIQQGHVDPDIRVTGHSLGGAEAQFQAATLGLAGTTFAALGAAHITAGSADLINYLYPQDDVANLDPHVGTVAFIRPNGPVQWQNLIETLPFSGEGLHFINNYLEHFGAPDVDLITPTQFVEAIVLSKVADYFSGSLAALPQATDGRGFPSDTQLGFDDLEWPQTTQHGCGMPASDYGGAGIFPDWPPLADFLSQAAIVPGGSLA